MANITTWAELAGMSLDGDHILMNDLGPSSAGYDTYASSSANGGLGWLPIGTFTGTFNGQGLTISGVYINRPATNTVALFSRMSPPEFGVARIYNLVMTDCVITGKITVAGLVASSSSSAEVTNCSVSGNLVASSEGGLLTGNTSNTNISKCETHGSVTITASASSTAWGGGFASNLSRGIIEECFSDATVVGPATDRGYAVTSTGIGGFCAMITGASLTSRGTLRNCYARGNVSGYTSAGFTSKVGYPAYGMDDSSDVLNCYSTGSAGDAGFCHTFAGGTITNSFWDTQTSGQSTSDGGAGRTTAQMKTQSTFTDWDFVTVWHITATINDGYPCFLWLIPEELILPADTDLTIVALQALRNIEMSAMGRVYVDEEGNLCYENRYSRQA